MKKKFEKPELEICEYVVAARLLGSGNDDIIGGPHSNGQGSTCSKTASNGKNSCAIPSSPSSSGGNMPCLI